MLEHYITCHHCRRSTKKTRTVSQKWCARFSTVEDTVGNTILLRGSVFLEQPFLLRSFSVIYFLLVTVLDVKRSMHRLADCLQPLACRCRLPGLLILRWKCHISVRHAQGMNALQVL